MKEYLKLGMTLLIICAISAGALAFMNSMTAPVIAENNRIASNAMYVDIYGDAADDYLELTPEELATVQSKYPNIEKVLNATKGEEVVGRVFHVTSYGYGGAMSNVIILNNDGSIAGFRNLSNGESPGFGNVISEESYYTRYNGKSVANGDLVLGSGGGANEIEAISGSTVTSKAVLAGLNEAVAAFKELYFNK